MLIDVRHRAVEQRGHGLLGQPNRLVFDDDLNTLAIAIESEHEEIGCAVTDYLVARFAHVSIPQSRKSGSR